ncbi:MAG: hypothetical protein JSV68_06595 [Anaerolineaceae bacterium]|nr:MAG: hypothetical protein JSV68_06595 [Anaerolineaceae bacterium]
MGNDKDKKGQNQELKTTRNIAYALLISYGASLILIGIVAAFFTKSPEEAEDWLDLFKSGFLILGGGLTTVIGYYFGSRGAQAAEERSAQAVQEAQMAITEAETERARALDLQEPLAPQDVEEGLDLPQPT